MKTARDYVILVHNRVSAQNACFAGIPRYPPRLFAGYPQLSSFSRLIFSKAQLSNKQGFCRIRHLSFYRYFDNLSIKISFILYDPSTKSSQKDNINTAESQIIEEGGEVSKEIYEADWFKWLEAGELFYEYRKNFPAEPIRAYFYVSKPAMYISGIAEFGQRELLESWLDKYKDSSATIDRINDYLPE